ncbi:hypothetical protein N5C70_02350 [Pseudomonas juntendi]|uniref:Uncharacterized protein n=1 Tax=Pseudomonas juntendi TaxID=2666183 RepID=A0ABD4Y898_9PSED|nr:hypothetical protein [Pseudomonas juntendi]MDH0755599.1 hypothetical protein [Pseudomonas juntendi]MDH1920330.1 hypothetical protein [Pseudomonas juntendi]
MKPTVTAWPKKALGSMLPGMRQPSTKVMSVVEHDDLGLTEKDYQEMLELFPDFSSPKNESKSAEPILSNQMMRLRLANAVGK